MALVKPVLNTVNAFDATQQQIFTFNYNGSQQIVRNTLTIRENTKNQVVYSQSQEGLKYEHILPANTLTNGVYYNAYLTVSDSTGADSPASSPIQFYCYAQPVFTLTNMPIGSVIENATYDFTFQYTQAQNQALNTYVVNLYDTNKRLISTSGELYANSTEVPLDLSYTISGFDNTTIYYIEITGVTVNNLATTTGLIEFTVRYTRPTMFTLLEITNMCDEGYVNITSNLISIDGETNANPPKYNGNEEIDLTDNGVWVKWTDGFEINGGFTTMVLGRKFNPCTNIITYSNANGDKIELFYQKGYDETDIYKDYVSAKVTPLNGMSYYIYSNYIDEASGQDYIFIWFRRVRNLYELQIENLGAIYNRITYYMDSINPDVYFIDADNSFYVE
nr:MAG TPA: hypothetical protein [Caudoviricetes sp.]